ncbi:MAG: LysR family transcriptional regulator [Burkholderiales bacterium]|nr:MAG: LysR family transcriptional regulator [Burkholderiales bacterium]
MHERNACILRRVPSPRTRPLPLTGLRGFEAAARLLSFTLAAQELGLTQSAVSRQIKGLETQLGRTLFRRGVRSLQLTEAGERLLRDVQSALREIDRTVADLRGQRRRRRLALTTAASLASLVLVPRLPEFSRLHPGVDLRIEAADTLRDLEGEGYDVAIRYFRHDRAPRGLRLLYDELLLPVLSPTLAARIGPIRRAADLGRATLLLEDAPTARDAGHWERWFARARSPMPAEAPRLMLSFTHQALDAALHEQGVMLAPALYVREHLATGRLVAPLGRPMPSGWGYYLVVNRDSANQRHVLAFIDWLEAVFAQADDPPG